MRSTLAAVVAFTVVALSPRPAAAHRLDEYLQATRIEIGRERVSLEIDLTPGATIAAEAGGWIDANGDGRFDPEEADAYAREVLAAVSLTLDAGGVALTLDGVRMPTLDEMRLGAGTIRLRASGMLPATRSGRHQLTFVNTHRRESSVYLANVLIPDDRRIAIVAQHHERDQHGLAIEYELAAAARWTRAMWLAGGTAGLLLLAAVRRRMYLR